MKPSSYQEHDYAFGQLMLTLRSTIGLTQTGLAEVLGVSRRSVANWEAGIKHPKAAHLKRFIMFAVAHQAFHVGHEADDIRALWKAGHQKELLNEVWLSDVLADVPAANASPNAEQPPTTEHVSAVQKAVPKPSSNLPFQPTTFVGRNVELAAIIRLLTNPACRLLTLHGPGGIGKTRLALAVAASENATFADGVAFVALASISMPNQIVSAIGEALRFTFEEQSDQTARLFRELRKRHMLLVLDNFEHLLEAAGLVAEMLVQVPQLTVVVTSRERLNLQAEWLFNVDGLTFPHQQLHTLAAAQSLATLSEYSAVELFIQRAKQVQPALALDQTTLATIVQICQHVEGMPLAIELAAASMRMLPVAEIERQIRVNLDVLATRLRDVPSRHRSMRAAVEHSWNLLSQKERVLFSHLAVFRSGWTAEAAMAVANATIDLLSTLADKSLVRASNMLIAKATTNTSPSAPELRFTMLEPIRGYALDQLVAQGEETSVRQAHVTFYLSLAETAAADWNTPAKETAIAQQAREHNNIRAALQWAYDTGNSTVGLRLALALWRFWRSFGYKNEGRAWLNQLLSLNEHPADENAIRIRERALHAAAWLASDQHDFANATQFFEQSLALRRMLGATASETNLADLLRNAARQARAEGQYEQASALLEDILVRHRVVGEDTPTESANLQLSLDELGQVMRDLGTLLREQGHFERAVVLLEQTLLLYRAMNDRASIAFALIALGDVARDQGDSSSVYEYCEPSLTILRELGIQWAIGFALNNLALAAYYKRDLARAVVLSRESVALFRANTANSSLAEASITLGAILLAQGDVAAAYEALTEALRFAWAVGPRLFVALALEGLANVFIAQENIQLAARLLAHASGLRTHMSTPIRPAEQATVEHTVITTRSALGEDAFAAIWAEAQTQSLEQLFTMLPTTGNNTSAR